MTGWRFQGGVGPVGSRQWKSPSFRWGDGVAGYEIKSILLIDKVNKRIYSIEK
jgi:hypothetical protein